MIDLISQDKEVPITKWKEWGQLNILIILN